MRKEEREEGIYYYKGHKSDDNDNERFYSPAKSQRSGVYKEEILGLRSENHKLKKNWKRY